MSNSILTAAAELSEEQFSQISNLVKQLCGINLHIGKKELVQARLVKRLRALHLADYSEYIDYLRRDCGGDELVAMMDVLSTNLTSFFREEAHFQLLLDGLLKPLAAKAARDRRQPRAHLVGRLLIRRGALLHRHDHLPGGRPGP